MSKKYVFLVLILLVIAIVSYLVYKAKELKKTFDAAVNRELVGAAVDKGEILTEEDIKHLPEPVQKYIRYANVIGKEKVRNFRVIFEGDFRPGKDKEWAKMNAEQHTNLDSTTRLYFMKMKMFGLPVVGLHEYTDGKATMLAKVAGVITVVDGKGPEMDEGETVTIFNDMCMLAPGSLIDKRIEWETVDALTVKAAFTNKGIKIHAVLYFNDKGELINFVSEDRYYSPTGETYEKVRWSTPVCDYKDFDGIRIGSGGEAVWSFPDGDFSYGKINIKDIKYNVTQEF